MNSVDDAGTSSAIFFRISAQNDITAWMNCIWWHVLASLYQWGRAQRKAHVFEMLLQRYCYWENFKLAVYLRFVGLRAYVLPFVVFVYPVWSWLVESTTANGTRLSFVRASERAPPQITRSSRVKVTYVYYVVSHVVSHPDWRGQSTLRTSVFNGIIRSFSQY